MNSSRIIFLILVSAIVLMGSIWLGVGVASNQTQTLVIVGAIMGLLVCIMLGQRIWLLFIFLFSMEVPVIRGLTSMEFAYFILIGFSVLMFLMRKIKLRIIFTEMDFWRFAVALMIVQVYMRNPVGLNMMGADSVGGRPYFIAAFALAAGTILSKYRVTVEDLKLSRWVAIASSFVMFPLNSWRYGLGRGPSLEQVSVVDGFEGGGAGRDGKYERLARTLSAILVSKMSPLRASFHPIWAFLVIAVLVAAAISGYRSSIAYVGIILLIGIAYHGGKMSLLVSIILATMALGSLAIINVAFPLPGKVQRALSPFPGTWEAKYVESADDSTEWRVDMWKAALLTDDWIKNKFLGDGLGMTREELLKMQELSERKRGRSLSGLNTQQESMMITGAYHSGPVQTIRTVGYFGLAVLLYAMIRMAVLTHLQIRRCWGTEWQTTILFFGIPIIAYPFYFTFIFGTFQDAIAFFFINSAIIDLFSNNLPLPAYQRSYQTIARPMGWRGTPSTDPATIAGR